MTATQGLFLFVGGGAGATCRYAVGRFVGERYSGEFPLGTFMINVSGCFALGMVASVLAGRSDNSVWTALISTGFLGGYTTFSTYALEGVILLLDRRFLTSALTVIGSIMLGLLAAALGAGLAHAV